MKTDFLKGIGSKTGTKGGNYFGPGSYLVQIDRCTAGEGSFSKKKFVAAECTVLETDVEGLKVGTPKNFLVMVDKFPELALGNIADFFRAGLAAKATALGHPTRPEEIDLTDEDADDICGEENILAGVRLKLFAYVKETRTGKPFTVHQWSVVGQ